MARSCGAALPGERPLTPPTLGPMQPATIMTEQSSARLMAGASQQAPIHQATFGIIWI